MNCPECGRGTNIRYGIHKQGMFHRTRTCSQGHVFHTVEMTRKANSSFLRVIKILEDPKATNAELRMSISNFIGDI